MEAFDSLLNLAISEDLGDAGDITSRAIFSDQIGKAQLVAKQSGVLAGVPYLRKTYRKIGEKVSIQLEKEDGAFLQNGDIVARLEGPVVSLLEGERIAINFLSFLSGIATSSRKYAQAADGRAVILDTRKTLPGYRALSKYAVSVGGAKNHRMGLYDMVMIKDNHADAAGSITAAVERVRRQWGDKYRIEVETRNLNDVAEAVEAGADIVMLDNMDEQTCAEALKYSNGKVLFEASGNMNLERVRSYSEVGVDFISVGALTHSVMAFDFSMRMSIDE